MLVLATDLDGTFLAGALHERNRLYQLIRSREDEIVLVFVTGRALVNVKPLLADPAIPRPHYVIADVGATILHGDTLLPVEPIDSELAARWIGEESVLRAIPSHIDIERQQQAQERRCSFYTDDPHVVEAIREAVAPLGCDVLYSAQRYLDILPSGVCKGATLRRLIEHLGIAPDSVLVAGDSLNDLSMFTETEFRGVVVGGCEPQLREHTKSRDRTHHAMNHGAGAILEAVEAFGLVPRGDLPMEPKGDAELVIVYHRQPFDEARDDGARCNPGSPNGILPTLLGLFRGGRKGAWIAWSTCDAARFETRTRLAEPELGNLTLSRVPLTDEDVDLFYRKLSKEALWPILHSFIERADFNHRHWQHFMDINRRFARHAAAEAAERALVWIHDYNLWLVPRYLRQLRPDVRIAFFHHTPFPAADIFNVIPWSRDIVESLLSCDYIGFHIPRYCENFVDTARSHYALKVLGRSPCGERFAGSGGALCVERVTTRIECADRVVVLGAHPVGIDLKRIRASLESAEFASAVRALKSEQRGRKIVLSAERLDYMKGPLRKLQAYERFLALYPAWREKIAFINICVPPSAGMSVYDEIRGQVEQAVGRINGRFATPGWSPITFMYRQESFERLAAYFAVADVAWITPLRDGLNLVAKEYVAVRSEMERTGVLIVSEFAGCAVELTGALPTNPYDVTEMAGTLQQALLMDEREQRERMRKLARIIRDHDVEHWANELIRCASACRADRSRVSHPEPHSGPVGRWGVDASTDLAAARR